MAKETAEKKQSKDIFYKIFQLNPFGVAILDAKTLKYVEVNENYLNIIGYERGEVIGHTSHEINITSPEARSFILERTLNNGTNKNEVVTLKKKSGELRSAEFSSSKIDIDGITHILALLNDVTERERIEKENRESEVLFQKMFDMNPLGMALYDAETLEYIKANDVFLKLTGYEREEIIGNTSHDMNISTPELRVQLLKDIKLTPTLKKVRYEFRKKSGDIRQGELSVSKLMLKNRLCFLNILDDITERDKAEKENIESKEFFQKMFEMSPLGAALLDEETLEFIQCNNVYLDLIGFAREEVIGKKSSDLNISMSSNRSQFLDDIRMKETQNYINLDFRKKSGEIRKGDISFSKLNINNRSCILTILNDVTERDKIEQQTRESKDYFAKLFQLTPAGIFLTNIKTLRYIEVNDHFLNITGYTRDELIGPFEKSIGVASSESRSEIVNKIKLNGSIKNELFLFRKKSGEIRTGEISSSQIVLDGVPCFLTILNDITEREKAEKERSETKDYFAKLFQLSPAGLSLVNAETLKYVEVNENYLNLTGYTREELIGSLASDINVTTPGIRNEMITKIKSEFLLKNELVTFIKKSGKTFTGELSTEFVYINNEKCYLSIVKDVTDRIKIEKENQESRELFTKIFELNPFAVALIKTDTLKYVEVNNSFLQLTGYNKEDIIGQTVSALNPSTQAALEKIQIGLMPDNLITNGVFNYQKKSNEIRTGYISTEIININDEKHFLSIFNDITEKNIIEEKARRLASSLAEAQRLGKIGSWEWNIEKNTVHWSSELYRIYGMEDNSFQPITQEFQEALHPEDKDRVNELIAEVRIQKKFPEYTYRIIRKNDGAVRILQARGDVKLSEEGEIISLTGTAQDITEQKQIEETFRQNALKLDLALNSSKIGSWELNLETNTYINSLRHDQIFGYEETVEPWSTELLFKHVLPEDRSQVEAAFAKAAATGEDLYFETRIKYLDGRIRWIWVRAQIYKDSFGKQNRMTGLIQDFTDRKRAELEMWQYARNIIEADMNPVVIIDFNGKITDMNVAFISVTATSRENILNTYFTQYFTEPSKATVIFHEVFQQGSVKSHRITFNDAAHTEVLLNGSVYKDDDGNVIGAAMVARDITELLRAQQMIIANEKRFSNILSQSMMLVAILKGKDMIIDFANDKILKSWGRGREIMNMPLLSALPELEYQEFPKFLQNVYETGIPHNEYEAKALLLRDGKYEDCYYTYAYLPFMEPDGNIGGITILATDVTEQVTTKKRQIENTERLQFIFDAIPQKVWSADPKGTINYFNKKWFEDKQFDIDALKSDGWKKILHPHDQTINERIWQQAMFTGESFQIEQRLLHHDGTYRWHLNRGLPYKGKSGKILMWVGTFTDIHEQKKLVETLETTAKIAEEEKKRAEIAKGIAENAVKSKQQFLANMSHEIRTPMNAIIGFTKVLTKTELSAKQKEYLQAIRTSGDTLIILLNDILDLAKVDSGKMTFEHIPFKPELSVSAMLHLFEPKIQEKNLELIKIYDSNIPPVLLGDPVRLHQIILNLVSNAVKFTANGSITVSVQLQHEYHNAVELAFSITDTGIGMAEDTIEVIFDNFQQASGTTARIYGGTGLGLAIVKQLVESQGGTIDVKSKLDTGSTFSFTLPFKKTKIQLTAEVEIEEVVKDIKNIKILVVEDVALNQLLMRTLLDEYGFGCMIAANGKIAIEKMKTETFDIILMDLQMPEMDGFETTEYIRKTLRSDVPIIALTADVTTADLSKCTAVGMDDYVSKPLDEKLLYTKILNHLKRMAIKNAEAAKILQNPPVEKIKYTDLKYLNERTKSNPAVIKQMIELYLEQTPPLVASLKQSYEEKNWHKLHATVHKMIPSFSIVGINKNYEVMAKRIMDLARAQEHADDMPGMIAQLSDICSNACTELQEYFNTLK